MEYIPKERDYIFVVFSKEVLKMPFKDLESLLGKLIEDSKVVL